MPQTRLSRRAMLDDSGGDVRGAALVVVSRRYHLHWPGVVFVLTTLLVALGAINSQHNLLYWVFGIAVGALLFSGILSGAVLMGVEIERVPPLRGVAGSELRVRYRVRNRSRFVPGLALHIEELTGKGKKLIPTWPEFVEGGVATFVPLVARRGEAMAEATMVPMHRGRMTFTALRVWTTFPFGITKKSVLFALPEGVEQETLVRPRALELSSQERAHLSSHSARSEETAMSGVGSGVPLMLREFAPGDSPRRIAWKRSALRVMEGRNPLVRQEARLSSGRLWIVLRGSGKPEQDEVAIGRAAGLLEHAARVGVPVGFSVPDADVIVYPSGSPRHLARLYDGLATIELPARQNETSPAARAHPRDVVIVLEGEA